MTRDALIALALVLMGPEVFVDASSNPIEDGRESLTKLGDVPWYDPQQDATGLPEKGWNWKWPKGGKWNLPGIGNLMTVSAWCILAGLLALIAYLLIRYFLDRENQESSMTRVKPTSSMVEFVQKLPFEIDSRTNDFLGEARRCYDAGKYSEAVVYLFCYQLIEMDRCHYIRLTRGKTNRQYLWELRSNEALRGLVEQTMLAFEDVFFGKYKLDRHQFEACWERLPEFEGFVRTVS